MRFDSFLVKKLDFTGLYNRILMYSIEERRRLHLGGGSEHKLQRWSTGQPGSTCLHLSPESPEAMPRAVRISGFVSCLTKWKIPPRVSTLNRRWVCKCLEFIGSLCCVRWLWGPLGSSAADGFAMMHFESGSNSKAVKLFWKKYVEHVELNIAWQRY